MNVVWHYDKGAEAPWSHPLNVLLDERPLDFAQR